MNRNELCRAALQFYGDEHQIRKCMEELSELSVAVCHCYDGKDSVRHVAEEIADVENLIEQMKILFNCHDQVDRQRRFKLEALADRMGLTFQDDPVLEPPVKAGINTVEELVDELDETERGNGGFGSTGAF